jgi:hypothetical protein
MREYAGTYLGIFPTDSSSIAGGEIRVGITDSEVKIAMAGGMELYVNKFRVSDYVPMRPEDLIGHEGAEIGEIIAGFKNKEHESFEFLFFKKPTFREPSLILRGGLSDFLGPTLLWNRKRFFHIVYLKTMLWWYDLTSGGNVPLLRRGGLIKSAQSHKITK